MMKRIILIMVLLVLLNGCDSQTCPTIKCPACKNDTVPEEPIEMMTIYKIEAGKESVFLYDDSSGITSIINCGNVAYGPLTVEKIKDITPINNLEIGSLIITNIDKNYIGGCVDILKEILEISKIYIYSKPVNTEEYNKLISWTPPSKLHIYENDKWGKVYNGNLINFSRVDGEIVKTDGVDYVVVG